MIKHISIFLFDVSYAVFFPQFLYAIDFVAKFAVPARWIAPPETS